MKNKIGWCDMTWNPVWGCLNNCEYCYARKINKRFWAKMIETESDYHHKIHQDWVMTGNQLRNLHDFSPTWFESQFNKKFPKKPQRIFVGSMSEIAHWEQRWMEVVLGRILCHPEHIFQFLTRYPEIYSKYDFPKNCWLGVTITEEGLMAKYETNWEHYFSDDRQSFFSFEPLLENINPYILRFTNKKTWVIVGAETGNRKGKVIPKNYWVEAIVSYCRDNCIPLYLKDNLKEIYPIEIKEFPYLKEVRTNV